MYWFLIKNPHRQPLKPIWVSVSLTWERQTMSTTDWDTCSAPLRKQPKGEEQVLLHRTLRLFLRQTHIGLCCRLAECNCGRRRDTGSRPSRDASEAANLIPGEALEKFVWGPTSVVEDVFQAADGSSRQIIRPPLLAKCVWHNLPENTAGVWRRCKIDERTTCNDAKLIFQSV